MRHMTKYGHADVFYEKYYVKPVSQDMTPPIQHLN